MSLYGTTSISSKWSEVKGKNTQHKMDSVSICKKMNTAIVSDKVLCLSWVKEEFSSPAPTINFKFNKTVRKISEDFKAILLNFFKVASGLNGLMDY